MGSTVDQPCRLCRQDLPLRKSHVVPEFLHTPVYDEDHSAVFYDMEAGIRGTRRGGLWENLLCQECEGGIARLEDYFADLWFHRNIRPKLVLGRKDCHRIPGLDYTRFKLFHLSIIWRAGISTLGPFSDIRLGRHEERLRTMLLNGTPGPPHVYRLCAIALQDDDGGYKDDMLQLPRPGKYAGHHFYSALFGGVFWLYVVSNHSGGWPVPSTLSEDGVLQFAAQHWTTNSAVL